VLGVVAEVLGDVATVGSDEDEEEEEVEKEREGNGPSWLDLGALSEKLNSLEEGPISVLSDGMFGLASKSYK
jgi:hypothetical protein